MKILITTILLCFVTIGESFCQPATTRQIPRESLSLQVNSTTFLTGEYLYYSVYCETETYVKGFNGSNIAYVTLVGTNRAEVFKHKIALEKGKGHSDFFIPNSVPSGSYKLLGYTHEMLNAKSKQFFEIDIHIVNPYQADQDAVMSTSEIVENKAVSNNQDYSSQRLDVLLEKAAFGKREKVSAVIQNRSAEKGFGTYTVSVRKLDQLPIVTNPVASKKTTSEVRFIPETQGYIYEGTLVSESSGAPLANESVGMSVPGNDFFFKATITDATGKFQFEIPTGIEGAIAYVRPLSSEIETFRIEQSNQQQIDYSKLSFSEYTITPAMKDDILARSIANQIENAYFSQKPDTSTARANKKSFLFYEVGVTYDLDDYTRFRTLEETFTEFVPSVYVSKNKSGSKEIRVFEKKFGTPTNDLPFFFVDGLWVRDPEQLLSLDARTLKTLKVIRRGYQFGNQDYFGVLLITSKDVAKNKLALINGMQDVTLFKPQPFKTYYQQRYDTTASDTYEKIPDYRHQLLWLPAYSVTAASNNITFYTSDVAGTFEIVVSGLNDDGKQIVLRKQFVVNEIAK